MTWIADTFIPQGRGNFSGELWWIRTDFTIAKRIFFPAAVAAVDRYPSHSAADNRLYLVGGHTSNILVDEDNRCWRQGMPTIGPPTVSSGAGATAQIGYFRTYDEITTERGPLSEGTAFTGDLNRAWTLPIELPQEIVIVEGLATIAAGAVTGTNGKANFDQLRPGDKVAKATDLTRWGRVRSVISSNSMTIDDTAIAGAGVELVAKTLSRASHIELWLSVSGAAPRFVMRVRLGTTSVTESTATLALGEVEFETFEAMPTGTISLFYNGRQMVAGVPGAEDSIFLSVSGFPERWGGLQLQTKYGEPVIGLKEHKTIVLAITPISRYRTQGFTDDDFVLDIIDRSEGGIGHHCNWNDDDGNTHITVENGFDIFNGSSHFGLPTRRVEFTLDAKRDRLAFELGIAAFNKSDGVGIFIPRYKYLSLPSRKAYCWVANGGVGPSPDGGITYPEWTSDTHNVPDSDTVTGGHVTYAAYLKPAGASVGHFYYGSDDGRIFVEDHEDDTFRDTDSRVVFFANNLGDFGGDDLGDVSEGKKWIRLWIYLLAELFSWRLRVWIGDDYIYPADVDSVGNPNIAEPAWWTKNNPVPPSASTVLTNLRALHTPKTVHPFKIDREGRAMVVELRLIQPKQGVVIGYGGEFAEGKTNRPVNFETTDPG